MIKVIDLFAGPGGLGEGFSSFSDPDGKKAFKVCLSIEKDQSAYKTLKLRKFFRLFNSDEVPSKYYELLRGRISEDELFRIYSEKHKKAEQEAWQAELGIVAPETVDERITKSLNGSSKWVLIGGPPCQAYSVVGRARRGGTDENDPRLFLYREYYRILAFHNPPVFIMENVRGILSSQIEGKFIFQQILNDLKNPTEAFRRLKGRRFPGLSCPGYDIFSLVKRNPEDKSAVTDCDSFDDFLIKSEEYGIPQTRHRVILLGIRKDFKIRPGILNRKEQVTLGEVLCGLPPVRSGLSKEKDSQEKWLQIFAKFQKNEILNEFDPKTRSVAVKQLKLMSSLSNDKGNEYIACCSVPIYAENWYIDKRLTGICNHSARGHIKEDLYRYFFASCYALAHNKSPKLSDFPKELLPKHKNLFLSNKETIFDDRFRVQLWDEPSKTITSHISKDGHYFIHPDPTQCRSLTVREAARLQSFPDNYYFCGPRTLQYIQVGNAVPPMLANQIAEIVYGIFKPEK